MSEIIKFYQFKESSCRHTLSDIWDWSNDQLEIEHDFIQWIFPLNEASSYNPDAPVLSIEDIKEFRNSPELQFRVMVSIHTFMRFLYRTVNHWCTEKDHNHLRITRMLKSLRLLGLDQEANNCYDELMMIICKLDMEEKMETPISFWLAALEPLLSIEESDK